MKYKVNDRVKVREDLVRGNIYGTHIVNDSMLRLCGNSATIQEVCAGYYLFKHNEWAWTDEMFSGLADERPDFNPTPQGISEPSQADQHRLLAAIMAMQALLANPNCSYNAESIAEDSIVYADALITELNKPKP